MKNKIFSGLDQLPQGQASEHITQGCAVLEGGAFRGVYGEGVLDALMEADINLQCTVGVSAGALNGANYVTGQIGRAALINLKYRHDSRYVGLRAYRQNRGIIGFDYLFSGMQVEPLDMKRLLSDQRRFVVVATSCLTGQPVYFEKSNCSDLLRAIQASASLPYISKPVDVDGVPCLDGGCSTKVPYEWAITNGYEKIVVVRTRPPQYRKPVKKNSPAKKFYRSYPDFAKVLAKSDEAYNAQCDQIEQLQKQGRIFVIAPSEPVTVRRLEKDMEKLGQLYYLGYHDAERCIDGLRKYLNEQPTG